MVASFSMAVSEGKDRPPIWVRVSAWEKLAEIVTQYVTKGKQVCVMGRLAPANAYVAKDGKPAASYEITAREIQLLGSREDGDEPATTTQATKQAEDDPASIPF
jgi:single-strand DNA-binding protein